MRGYIGLQKELGQVGEVGHEAWRVMTSSHRDDEPILDGACRYKETV